MEGWVDIAHAIYWLYSGIIIGNENGKWLWKLNGNGKKWDRKWERGWEYECWYKKRTGTQNSFPLTSVYSGRKRNRHHNAERPVSSYLAEDDFGSEVFRGTAQESRFDRALASQSRNQLPANRLKTGDVSLHGTPAVPAAIYVLYIMIIQYRRMTYSLWFSLLYPKGHVWRYALPAVCLSVRPFVTLTVHTLVVAYQYQSNGERLKLQLQLHQSFV